MLGAFGQSKSIHENLAPFQKLSVNLHEVMLYGQQREFVLIEGAMSRFEGAPVGWLVLASVSSSQFSVGCILHSFSAPGKASGRQALSYALRFFVSTPFTVNYHLI